MSDTIPVHTTGPVAGPPERRRRFGATPPTDLDDGQYELYVRRQRRRTVLRKLIRGLIGFAVVLVLWQLLSSLLNIELLLPTPWTTLTTLIRMLTLRDNPWPYGYDVYYNALISTLHAMVGFAIAAALAIPAGLLVGRVRWAQETIAPVLKAFYPIPGVAWIPLAILWFGLGNTAVVFVVTISTFFPLYYNTEAGARSVDPTVLDVANCYGMRGTSLFLRVVLPASIPFIVSGLRIAVGTAWRMIVTGEMLAGQIGIGYVLMQSRLFFRAPDLLSFMIVISVIGYATERIIVGTLEKRTLERWEVKRNGG
jgi:ABC-type nitrate/sulfonate/bicarbonate transport system permease component